jgi:plasmid stabilization system protein ParE
MWPAHLQPPSRKTKQAISVERDQIMRGSKAKYTEKQKRKAEHIEGAYEEKGVSGKRAEKIAWATVNKQSGGGEKSGSGRNKSAGAKADARKDSAQRAVATKSSQTKAGALEKKTKSALLDIARSRNIAGRSQMNKQDLITALRSPRNS